MRQSARGVLVGGTALLSMLLGCSYHHPTAPRGADLDEISDGIHRNIEVGSVVRLETNSGEKISGEVLSLDEEVLVLSVKSSRGEEARAVEIRNIKVLTVKTWRKDDTIVFTVLGAYAVFLAWATWALSGLGGGFG